MNDIASALLEARDVTQAFQVRPGLFGRRRTLAAVSDVSLQLGPGEVVGLVGESGCGKSTLARMLLGLLTPSRGEVRLGGVPLARLGRREIGRRIQPVFQDPYGSLNPRKRVREIVALPLKVHGIGDRSRRRQLVREMLDRVGLPQRLEDALPGQLSGGQRQRVAIARALVSRPGILVCDEPTSALDVSVQSQILNLLMDLRREFGLAYLVISHNLAVVEHLCDRVAVMYLGRIVEEGDTEALFRAPRHPYTRALMESVLTPVPGLGVPDAQLGADYPNPLDPPAGCRFHPRCPLAHPRCTQAEPEPMRDGANMVACHLWPSPGAIGKHSI